MFCTKHLIILMIKPSHLNAPVKFTSLETIKLTLQQKRLQSKQLKEQISVMKKSLDTGSQRISPQLSNNFQELFLESDNSKSAPFMKLFW